MWVFYGQPILHVVVLPLPSHMLCVIFATVRGRLSIGRFSRNVRGIIVLWTGWLENAAVRLFPTENPE